MAEVNAHGSPLELPGWHHTVMTLPSIAAPWPSADRQPCWHCTAYDGLTAGGSAALCSRPLSPRVRSSPETGCCGFQRELGTDDEPDHPPAGFLGTLPHPGVWKAREAPAVMDPVLWAP